MTAVDYLPRILGGTPPWVWGVLVLLVFLGVRRLKARRTHLLVAALAPVGFTVWSLTGVFAAMRAGSAGTVLGAWAVALSLGAVTALVHRGPRPLSQGGGVFLFPASIVPLLIYLAVFAARYGLGVWAALEPRLAGTLALAAVVISAATAGRFIADFAPLARAARQRHGFAGERPRTN